MSRKIPALLLFLALTISALQGCSGGKNRVVNEDTLDSQEIVTITFFGNKYVGIHEGKSIYPCIL